MATLITSCCSLNEALSLSLTQSMSHTKQFSLWFYKDKTNIDYKGKSAEIRLESAQVN